MKAMRREECFFRRLLQATVDNSMTLCVACLEAFGHTGLCDSNLVFLPNYQRLCTTTGAQAQLCNKIRQTVINWTGLVPSRQNVGGEDSRCECHCHRAGAILHLPISRRLCLWGAAADWGVRWSKRPSVVQFWCSVECTQSPVNHSL